MREIVFDCSSTHYYCWYNEYVIVSLFIQCLIMFTVLNSIPISHLLITCTCRSFLMLFVWHTSWAFLRHVSFFFLLPLSIFPFPFLFFLFLLNLLIPCFLSSCSYSYVSRVNPRDSSSHQILGIQTEKPEQLASQLTLDIQNAWGILHAIIDYCRELDSGKYIIMKDPNKVSYCKAADTACILYTSHYFSIVMPQLLLLYHSY